jgi:hypothetical protein
MMITAAQKVEHYEIATYGTIRTYAQVLGERNVERLLNQTLREEKAADKKLTDIAEGAVNNRAAKEWHERSTATDMLSKGTQWIGATVGSAMRRVLPGNQAADRSGRKSQSANRGSSRRARGRARGR